ncbi:hypothetical protein N657DRAFT_664416 [Parathielavia appendiculata]|uniref:DUF4211 domain-containing protein n=1 Tax=Parathielavia appendiculata TaxID=2587402 RepID=A0AAN6U154_9PEZI|nr:hypothetical protein N657DRAFT_664416 [Parathielavia appendiculata]
MVKHKKEKQQTLEATLGRPRVRPAIKTPKTKGKSKAALSSALSSSPAGVKSSPKALPSSFMHSSQVGGSARKRTAVLNDESSEKETSEDDDVQLLVRERKRGKKHPASSSSSSAGLPAKGNADQDNRDAEEDDDMPPVTPTARRKRRRVADESDDDDEPLASSAIKRRRLVRRNGPPIPAKEDQKESEDDEPAPSSTRTSRTRRKPLTKKEKARQLLRRKRAGEVINEDEETSSSEEEEPAKKAMYDTDSDHLALNEFEDDEEGVPDLKGKEEARTRKKKERGEKRRAVGSGDEESEGSIDDFVVDDSDAPLGVPEDALLNMPLEFTKHSHKPLKEHFRDAVEWLVQFKINPGFSEKEHPLYRMAWKKLDDEVRGLATSKFASAAWKKDFYMALRARPYFTSEELPKSDLLESRSCGACGRSGHPARHVITFTGTPYFKDTTKLDRFLEPVELDSDSESGSELHDLDEDGNPIPKETNKWSIGVVCNSNAEAAHNLIHWKYALLDWVDTRLHEEGHMAPSKLAERERMWPKQKYKLVDSILEHWVANKVVKALYSDFKGTIEEARNKKTTGRYR